MRFSPLCLVLALAGCGLASAAIPAPNLIGHWTGSDFDIVLNADGSGTLKDSASSPAERITWKASAGRLSVTEDGEEAQYTYSLSGDQLRLSGGDLETPVSLSRAGAAGRAGAAAVEPQKAAPSAKAKDGTCVGSCQHLLTCSRAATPQYQAQCVLECQGVGYESAFLGWFESTDCETAIAIITALEQQKRGLQSGGQQGSSASGSSECKGCVRDGSECNWYSQSNWGQGAYSGAVITCNPSCCQR